MAADPTAHPREWMTVAAAASSQATVGLRAASAAQGGAPTFGQAVLFGDAGAPGWVHPSFWPSVPPTAPAASTPPTRRPTPTRPRPDRRRRALRWRTGGMALLVPEVSAPPPALAVAVLALALALVAPSAPAIAQQAPFVRGIEVVCPPEARAPDRFPDAGGTHREAVNCMAAYGIALGRPGPDGREFDPSGTVTREQMATFIARSIEVTGAELPLGEPFPDVGQVHGDNVRKLAGAGIATGLPDGTFGASLPVTRAQMATFIAQALRYLTGDELPPVDAFSDVSGTHAANVGSLAAVGVVGGRADGTYDPTAPVTRAQMASFLARMLAESADRGV